MHRRHLLLAVAAGLAAPRFALADQPERVPLSSAFKYLDKYLALPPPLRNHFYLVFKALRDNRPAPDLKLAIVGPGPPQPVPLDAQAQVTRLPTLAQLKSNASLEVWGGPFRFITEIRPDVAPSTRLDVAELRIALSQTTAAVAHIAGAFSAMAPRFNTAVFPDAGSGQVVFADGRAAPLPITHAYHNLGPTPYLPLDAMPEARAVTLARTPSRILLSPTLKS